MSLVKKCDICGCIEGVDENETGQVTFSDGPLKLCIENYRGETYVVYLKPDVKHRTDDKNMLEILKKIENGDDDTIDEYCDFDEDTGKILAVYQDKMVNYNPLICDLCIRKTLRLVSERGISTEQEEFKQKSRPKKVTNSQND